MPRLSYLTPLYMSVTILDYYCRFFHWDTTFAGPRQPTHKEVANMIGLEHTKWSRLRRGKCGWSLTECLAAYAAIGFSAGQALTVLAAAARAADESDLVINAEGAYATAGFSIVPFCNQLAQYAGERQMSLDFDVDGLDALQRP
jgi:hypothetical protein